MKKITKKAFRERCSFHTYVNMGTPKRTKTKVIYYDWKERDPDIPGSQTGFKYAIREGRGPVPAKELFNAIYNWAVNDEFVPYYMWYKYATSDADRFKVPLSLNF